MPAYPVANAESGNRATVEFAQFLQANAAQDAANGPIAPLLLAIRSGRLAVERHPDDAAAFLALGQAYLRLLHSTVEKQWGRHAKNSRDATDPGGGIARRGDSTRPQPVAAHVDLYQLFASENSPDLALRELKEILRLSRLRQGGAERIQAIEAELARLDAQVTSLRRLIPTAGSVLDRASVAASNRLFGDALDLLLAADFSAFGSAA